MARSLGVTQKVSSNSKHTLLCLCGHNVLARIKPNTIENTAVVRPSGWNTIPRDEQKCISVCHTFYMSYDKHVKRMTSMYICLHYSLHGYFFIKLQAHFYTTVNQCVNKSIRQ